MGNSQEYSSLQESTRVYYEEYLNWRVWANTGSALLHQKIDKKV
jgi:hypothetical protein